MSNRDRRLAALAKEIAYLLRSLEVQNISFKFGSQMIFPSTWSRVADALVGASPRISVQVALGELIKQRAAATYNLKTNCLMFASFLVPKFAEGRGAIVHECLHAIQDSHQLKGGTSEIEAAAHVAEAWYHINAGTRRASPFRGELMELVEKIRSRKLASMPAILTTEEQGRFKAAISTGGYYKDRQISFNGW